MERFQSESDSSPWSRVGGTRGRLTVAPADGKAGLGIWGLPSTWVATITCSMND